MADQTPYEIWVVTSTGEYPLIRVTGALGLSDSAAKTLAVEVLQAAIDKINTPTPDSIEVRKGVIFGPQVHIRLDQQQDDLTG